MDLLIIALAPVVAILFYIYYRDKYEKEPVKMLILAFLVGMATILPILVFEHLLLLVKPLLKGTIQVFWDSFVVAALTEEFFKLLFLYLFIWKSPAFNEKFDGIVYAVFVSMGFATVENLMYVFETGASTGLIRALTAVPSHFLFGVTMGFYIGLARFYPVSRTRLLQASFLFPFALHGTYDFLLMSAHPYFLLLFIPFILFLWQNGLRKIEKLSALTVIPDEPEPPFNTDSEL